MLIYIYHGLKYFKKMRKNKHEEEQEKMEEFKGSGSEPLSRIFELGLIILGLVLYFIPMYIAIKCNPQDPFLYGLAAFLFPEFYIIQYLIRKYMLKQAGYCTQF